jgi:23S rRNA (adenine2503-C2)-methyltransferase
MESNDGRTSKVVFKTISGLLIEAVLMRHDDRNTVCVSCMSGCPVGCKFCATGRMGLKGLLSADEIVDQVLYFARLLKGEDSRPTNVVYMGMGEPMLNLGSVERSIRWLTSEEGLGLGQRRITVSTSGYIPQLKLLREHGYKGKIAVSLHASNQKIREELMPVVAKAYPLDKLMTELDKMVEVNNKRISYEYILIAGVNDLDTNAQELSLLLKNRLAHVNLIPYNEVDGVGFSKPNRKRVHDFFNILESNGIPVSVRETMGDDISGACGQLAGKVRENLD